MTGKYLSVILEISFFISSLRNYYSALYATASISNSPPIGSAAKLLVLVRLYSLATGTYRFQVAYTAEEIHRLPTGELLCDHIVCHRRYTMPARMDPS